MKKWMNFVLALPLLVVYFIGIYAPNTQEVSFGHHSSEFDDTISAGNSIDLPFHLLNSDSSSSWISSTFKITQQSLNVHFVAIAVIMEQIYRAELLQLKYRVQNAIAHYRNTLIFFPFHYFW